MDEKLHITHEKTPEGGVFSAQIGSGPRATMTYRATALDVILIDHTFVPPQYRGQGVAAMLVNHAIADARANNLKIIPRCSYVAAQFKRHPEWQDLHA